MIEFERYITKNYYELKKICDKITKNSDWSQDLLHEVIIQLLQKKEYKGKLDDNSLKYYIIKCLTINWWSKTSPFFRKIKRESTLYVELYDFIDEPNNEDNNEHRILELVENEWTEMNWFYKLIFSKWMLLGSLKKVSVETTIPLTSIARYVKETRQSIIKNTYRKFENE